MKNIPGAKPFFLNKKKLNSDIKKILNNGILSSGPHLKKFENLFKKKTKVKFAAAVNSGGTALEIALESLNIRNKEVIVPTQTFIATANSVIRAGGTPIFCDIDQKTGCVDLNSIKKKITKKTAGVVFVYMFGIIPKSVLDIKKYCKKKNIFLLEDASHAHGASIENYKIGSIGDLATFSFYSTKVLTCGEGGVITTNSKKLYDKCKIILNHGKDLKKNLFVYSGNNFRLSEIQCLLAYNQLKYLDIFIKHRNKIAKIYFENLKDCKFVELFKIYPQSLNSFWRYPLYLKKGSRKKLQNIFSKKYKIRITWMYEPLCHQQPVFKSSSKFKLPEAEKSIKKLINLPTHYGVSAIDAKRISMYLKNEIVNL